MSFVDRNSGSALAISSGRGGSSPECRLRGNRGRARAGARRPASIVVEGGISDIAVSGTFGARHFTGKPTHRQVAEHSVDGSVHNTTFRKPGSPGRSDRLWRVGRCGTCVRSASRAKNCQNNGPDTWDVAQADILFVDIQPRLTLVFKVGLFG